MTNTRSVTFDNNEDSIAVTSFDQVWQDWLQSCRALGCDLMDVSQILLDHNFSVPLIHTIQKTPLQQRATTTGRYKGKFCTLKD
ncbi:MAG: hypothetical protein ACJA13_002095 [Paraglaciecola sp.]|jgi:hypothetical protein